MGNSKKNLRHEKQDSMQEPLTIYGNEKVIPIHSKEKNVGFDMDGNSISEKEYIADIHNALNSLADGKLETYSSEEVKRRILG